MPSHDAAHDLAAQLMFVSYNKADKESARALAAQLTLSGADVWLDEWEIQAGDSIPGRLNEGLGAFNTFVLLWSSDAYWSQPTSVEWMTRTSALSR